jgi:DNA-binding XRE family transcriptional regulator
MDRRKVKKFWGRVKKCKDGCWDIVAGRPPKRYGRVRIDGQLVQAHRFVWELTYGPIPKGMKVCHDCDNPSCVNPEHLFLGTQKDNMQDAVRKGRMYQPKVKLTGAQVVEIRERYAIGGITQRELGEEFGVDRRTVTQVVTGANWKLFGGKLSTQNRRKLTVGQVAEIRKKYRDSGVLQCELAEEYEISRSAISLIVRRKRWRQV